MLVGVQHQWTPEEGAGMYGGHVVCPSPIGLMPERGRYKHTDKHTKGRWLLEAKGRF